VAADDDVALLKSACMGLMEHFDTVHIFATRHRGRDAGTTFCNWGSGNWYARYGQVRTWILRQEAWEDQQGRNPDKETP